MHAIRNACVALGACAVVCGAMAALAATAAAAEAAHAIAMHGAPAMPDGFTVLPYANPDAPKGGRLVQGVLGTFDSLNPAHRQGPRRAGDPRLCGRKPDGARL